MYNIHAAIVWDDERAKEIAKEIDQKILEIGDLYKELTRLGYVEMGKAPEQLRQGFSE